MFFNRERNPSNILKTSLARNRQKAAITAHYAKTRLAYRHNCQCYLCRNYDVLHNVCKKNSNKGNRNENL